MKEQITVPDTEEKRPGFFYGYVIVIAGVIAALAIYGAQYSFGVFFKPMLEEFGWTRAATSGAYSLCSILQGVSGVFAGRLSDRFGPRLVVTTCGLLMGLGYLLMSQVHAIWQIYLFFGVLVGIGPGGFVPVMSTAARWFVKRRGLMCGTVNAGVGIGITIVPPIANQLITRYNWRISYIIVGLAALVITVIASQFLKRDPRQVGQLAYGANTVKTEEVRTGVPGLTLGEAVRTRQLWLICAVLFLVQSCVQIIMVHIVPHTTDIGISAATAATILSIIGALSIGTKIGMGNVVDRLDGKRVVAFVFILMSGVFLWLPFASRLWMLYLFTIIFALAYGGQSALQSPIVAEYFGLKAHGAIFGVVFLSMTTGGAIDPLVAGRIFDVTGSYNLAFIVYAILSIMGLLLLVPLKHIRQNHTANRLD